MLGPPKFLFVGGYSWLDLVNTQVRREDGIADLLGGLSDWFDWLRDDHVLPAAEIAKLKSLAARDPDRHRFLADIKEFRAQLREAAQALDSGRKFPRAALSQVNGLLERPIHYPQLVVGAEGFRDQLHYRIEHLRDSLVPIAESVRDFLLHADPALVRKCENDECVLFFYDTTKNHTRRWCSMNACGNRFKAAAYYARRRNSAAQEHA